MSKEHSLTSHKKKDMNNMILIISLLAVAILFIADLNVMINMPANIIAIVGITALLLIWLYLFIKSILTEMKNSKVHMQEQFENMLKSEKASFLLLRKAFDEMSQLENSVSVPSEDIITAQKAIAKVTISRSKENTDALLNSNDKVMERLLDFEEKLSMNNEELLDRQKLMIDDSLKELLMKQQEMLSGIKEMELTIHNELSSLINTIHELQEKQEVSVQRVIRNELANSDIYRKEDVSVYGKNVSLGDTPELKEDSLMETTPELSDELEEFSTIQEDSLFDEMPELSVDSELGELPAFDEVPLMETIPELSDEPELIEIPSIEDEPLIETELFDEQNPGELPVPEDSLLEEEPVMPEIPVLEEETLADETTEIPVLEEETLADETTEDPAMPEEIVLEEKPVKESVTVQEQKPAMPDLSDPHKLMTPDEIAALIANL